MKMYSYVVKTVEEFATLATKLSNQEEVINSRSVIVRFLTYDSDGAAVKALVDCAKKFLPGAKVIGASSSGEISGGRIYEQSTAVSVMCFENANIHVFGYDCKGPVEATKATDLCDQVMKLPDVKGIEILSDVKSINTRGFSMELSKLPEDIAIFGGGADAYDNGTYTIVFDENNVYEQGLVAAVYCGEDLEISSFSNLGWKSLGKSMRITKTSKNGVIIDEIDGEPAINVYRNYLKIENDANFHRNVGEFPVIVKRNGYKMARVPVTADEKGAIEFGADVNEGEMLRIGYGDPEDLMESTIGSAERMTAFDPQGILLFCCITRKVFLKEYAVSDVIPFSEIGTVSGFYTYGEIIRLGKNVETLNCSLVCVGFREGEKHEREVPANREHIEALEGHMSVVQRLVHFLEATTADLEEANRQLRFMATHDNLTKLLNRGAIEEYLKRILMRVDRKNDKASVIMADIDDFKKINDEFGHDAGDHVLVKVAEIFMKATRGYDINGRWGGEEFMILLPGADQAAALATAERIRADIESCDFGSCHKITVSFGVAELRCGENLLQSYKRVDGALYAAKKAGKNKVKIG